MAGILQGDVKGENIDPEVYEEDFYDDASDQDIERASSAGGLNVFLSDTTSGFQIGSAAGPIGSLIGAIAGSIIGIIDAGVSKDAMQARITEERDFREKLERELEEVMDMRTNMVRHLEAMMHPLEQSFRARARAFGAQARAQGLTGAQAVYAQIEGERFYRESIGPALPSIMNAATAAAREDAIVKLRGLEAKYGIDLQKQQLQLQEDMVRAELKGNFVGGLTAGLTNLGALFGALGAEVDDLSIDKSQKQSKGGNIPTGSAGTGFGANPKTTPTGGAGTSSQAGEASKLLNDAALADEGF